MMAGVEIQHVPFKGGGPALIDVMGGDTHMSFASVVTTGPHIRSGKLRALGVGGVKRSVALPDVPTIDEAGVPGYECANWIGFVAPAGTPESIVALLHKELIRAQDSPEMKKLFMTEGAEDGPHEHGRIRRLHRKRNRQMGQGGQTVGHETAIEQVLADIQQRARRTGILPFRFQLPLTRQLLRFGDLCRGHLPRDAISIADRILVTSRSRHTEPHVCVSIVLRHA